MAKIVQETRVELAEGELLALERADGQMLSCQSGELWITLDGSQEDIILGAGQNWRVTGDHPVVVSALQDSLLVSTHPGSARHVGTRGRAEAILAALLRWKHSPLAGYPATLLR